MTLLGRLFMLESRFINTPTTAAQHQLQQTSYAQDIVEPEIRLIRSQWSQVHQTLAAELCVRLLAKL
jgi:hypothetical protein